MRMHGKQQLSNKKKPSKSVHVVESSKVTNIIKIIYCFVNTEGLLLALA